MVWPRRQNLITPDFAAESGSETAQVEWELVVRHDVLAEYRVARREKAGQPCQRLAAILRRESRRSSLYRPGEHRSGADARSSRSQPTHHKVRPLHLAEVLCIELGDRELYTR